MGLAIEEDAGRLLQRSARCAAIHPSTWAVSAVSLAGHWAGSAGIRMAPSLGRQAQRATGSIVALVLATAVVALSGMPVGDHRQPLRRHSARLLPTRSRFTRFQLGISAPSADTDVAGTIGYDRVAAVRQADSMVGDH